MNAASKTICERCALAVHRKQINLYDANETECGKECADCLAASKMAIVSVDSWADFRGGIASVKARAGIDIPNRVNFDLSNLPIVSESPGDTLFAGFIVKGTGDVD